MSVQRGKADLTVNRRPMIEAPECREEVCERESRPSGNATRGNPQRPPLPHPENGGGGVACTNAPSPSTSGARSSSAGIVVQSRNRTSPNWEPKIA
jgi:hypothetical protein